MLKARQNAHPPRLHILDELAPFRFQDNGNHFSARCLLDEFAKNPYTCYTRFSKVSTMGGLLIKLAAKLP